MLRTNATDKEDSIVCENNQASIHSLSWKFEVRKQKGQDFHQYSSNNDRKLTGPSPVTNTNQQKYISNDPVAVVETEKNEKGPQRPVSGVRINQRKDPLTSTLFSLSYTEKGLTALPAEVIENKDKLNLLDLSVNRFEYFPTDLLFLKSLKVLRLDNNRIKCLPNDFSHLQQLEMLSLSYNLLQYLPSTLCKLPNLYDLNVEFNLINALGPEITDLKSLKVLNINKNRLVLFPSAFCDMVSVNDLCFEWFKYANPPIPARQRGREGEERINKLRETCKELRQKNQKGMNFQAFVETVSTAKVNLQALDDAQKSFLHYSALYEDISVMKFLISSLPALLDLTDKDGQTPLTSSIIKEKYLAARYLLKHGANPTKGGGIYGSPLHIAVRKLNMQLVKDLVKLGENLNKIDQDGHTPLHHSIALMADANSKAIEITQFLLEMNANPNPKNKENWTPLHLATRKKDLKTIEWILLYNKEAEEIHGRDERFKLDQKGGAYKWTAMHIAAYSDAPLIIETLARAKCEVFKKSLNGYTPKRLVHHLGLSVKYLEKYEKHYLYHRILNKQTALTENLADLNLQNLNKAKEIFNASKNKFENVMLYEEGNEDSPLVTCEDNTNVLMNSARVLKRPNFKVKSKDPNESFEVTPETEAHNNSFTEEHESDITRLNFNTDLNENISIKPNAFAQGINIEKSFKTKEANFVRNPSKNKFSANFVQFINMDVTNYEKHLLNESRFDYDFCKKELKVIRDYFYLERIIYTEKMKIFVLLRILHQQIIKHILKELKIKLALHEFQVLAMKDLSSATVKNSLRLSAKKSEVHTASILLDLIPQTLIAFYSGAGSNYEGVILKSTIISMIEELFYYNGFGFLESILKDASESIMTKQNAKRSLINLRNIYDSIVSKVKIEQPRERISNKQRTRSLSPVPHPQPDNDVIDSSIHERGKIPEGKQISSGMKLNTKITFTPITISNK